MQGLALIFGFGFFQPLYWLYRREITRCIFLSINICIGLSSYNVNHEKQIWPVFGPKLFQFLAHFRQLLLAQPLRHCQVHNYGRWAFMWCRQNYPSVERL